MGRRIEIELTSTRDDGTWTWRAAGAREPKGSLAGDLLPEGVKVGDVVRADLEGFIDGMQVVNVLPPKTARSEPQRLELIPQSSNEPLVTTARVKGRRDDRGPRRGRGDGERGRGDRPDRRERGRPDSRRGDGERERGRGPRRSAPPEDTKPKPKRLRPARTHRSALLESLKTEERPIAEQLLQGGIPAVRQAIQKQNEQLRSEKKPEVNADALLSVAERLRPKALAATWRDRADAALKNVDELDLRDLRSVVNAAGDAGRDDESRQVADQLREALARRIESEQAAWVAEVAQSLTDERVVRALRLSSRPPKAGSPLPGDLTQQLIAATTAALTSETGPQRWATVLEALAYSPIRRRVVPESLPEKLTPELRETIARLATRIPEIAHIFDISPEEAPVKPPRQARRKGQGRKGDKETKGDARGAKRGDRNGKDAAATPKSDSTPEAASTSGDEAPGEAEASAEQPGQPDGSAENPSSDGAVPTDQAGAPDQVERSETAAGTETATSDETSAEPASVS